MAFTAKPFSWAQKIVKTAFLPRPAIFSHEDLNRYLDIITTYQNYMMDKTNMVRFNWSVSAYTLTGEGTAPFHVTGSMTLSKVDSGEGAYVYFKGVRFDIPMGTYTCTDSLIDSSTPYPEDAAFLYLIAEKTTTEFADDNAISGVSSDEFPTALPSSDNDQYHDERLVLAFAESEITLAADEEIIGVIASIVTNREYSDDDNWFTHDEVQKIRYNAVDYSDIINDSPYTYNARTFAFKGNDNFLDAWLHFQDDWARYKSFLDVVMTNVSTIARTNQTVLFSEQVRNQIYNVNIPSGLSSNVLSLGGAYNYYYLNIGGTSSQSIEKFSNSNSSNVREVTMYITNGSISGAGSETVELVHGGSGIDSYGEILYLTDHNIYLTGGADIDLARGDAIKFLNTGSKYKEVNR